ncbi:MAG: hypothetical protein CMP08_06690 [Xanthomonadales bacterium]|nr:hypothetical protein [Xanthomonadales bacterium]|tara:strand:- start:107 stop:373 length:267 start_codon:yes stop_codon:yes gene_type:complete
MLKAAAEIGFHFDTMQMPLTSGTAASSCSRPRAFSMARSSTRAGWAATRPWGRKAQATDLDTKPSAFTERFEVQAFAGADSWQVTASR